jgi:hypothetical protein
VALEPFGRVVAGIGLRLDANAQFLPFEAARLHRARSGPEVRPSVVCANLLAMNSDKNTANDSDLTLW